MPQNDDHLSLFRLATGIYAVEIKSTYHRAEFFVRFQEFYESQEKRFRGKFFRMKDFRDWYSLERPGSLGYFSYHDDWVGYNIPSNVVRYCFHQILLNDPSELTDLDRKMYCVLSRCDEDIRTSSGQDGIDDFYLIGVDEVQDRPNSTSTRNHEIAHAMYLLDKSYKSKCHHLVCALPDRVRKGMNKILKEYGYVKSVFEDETQAYLSTGLTDLMKDSKIGKDLEEVCAPFEENFNAFNPVQGPPKKLKIKF